MIVFITGGAKNGKSSYAQELAVKLFFRNRQNIILIFVISGKEKADIGNKRKKGDGQQDNTADKMSAIVRKKVLQLAEERNLFHADIRSA